MGIKAALALFVFLPGAANAADVVLTKGRLIRERTSASQALSLKNNSAATLNYVAVECGFFQGTSLIVTGLGITANVGAGQTAYFNATADHAEQADTTDCRVKSAR